MNTYKFKKIIILWQVTLSNFNDPELPNYFISVYPNIQILSNNSVLILKTIINIVTWTSESIKSTEQIIIVIYIICTWTNLYLFNRSNIITTNVIFRTDHIIIDIEIICTWPHFWFFNKTTSSKPMLYLTCSIPRRAVCSHSLVCSKNHLLIVGIGKILNKELELIFRSDRSDRTCIYS